MKPQAPAYYQPGQQVQAGYQQPGAQYAQYPQYQQYPQAYQQQAYAPPVAGDGAQPFLPPQAPLPGGGGHGELVQDQVEGTRCRDKWCAIFFVGHLVAVLGGGAYAIHSYAKRDHDGESWSLDKVTVEYLILLLVLSAVAGIIAAMGFTLCLRPLKGKTVVFSVGAHIALMVVGIGLFMYWSITPGAIAIGVYIALLLLYLYCVRRRIPFTETLIDIANRGLGEYRGVYCVGVLMGLVSMLWTMFVCVAAIMAVANSTYGKSTGTGPDHKGENTLPRLYIFLFCLELIWANEVFKNISFVTTAGAMGTWWYQPGANSGVTTGAFKRASTTSLGSIAFGSLLVAFVRALRWMVRLSEGNRGRNSIAACLLICLLNCIERLLRVFNVYAFCHVALYGKDYVGAAKDVMDMFESRGFLLIINDHLVELVVALGRFIAGLVALGAVGLPCYLKFKHLTNAFDGFSKVGLMLVCFEFSILIGIWVSGVVLAQIRSAVALSLVAWAEDPSTVQQNRPDDFRALEDSRNLMLSR